MEILAVNVIRTWNFNLRTAELIVQNKKGERKMIHVKTKNRKFCEDLNSSVYFVHEGSKGCFKGNLIKEYFDDYDKNIREILGTAEEYVIHSCAKDVASTLTLMVFFGILVYFSPIFE